MPEVSSGPEYFPTILPENIGAVFTQGKYGPYVERKAIVVPDYDIAKGEDRNNWLFENMNVFSDGTTPSPELRWKRTVDDWLGDIKVAARRGRLERKLENDLELDIKAMMAVSASARAMEHSGGSAEKYGVFITLSEKPDLDKQDDWSDFLLHNDPDKLNRVINNPLIRHYYDTLLKDAGVKAKEWEGKSKSQIEVDIAGVRGKKEERRLFQYLEDGAKKGGFDGYIEEILLEDDKDVKGVQGKLKQDFVEAMKAAKIELKDSKGEDKFSLRWAAAKLACDAFLVDKFTRWEYVVTDKGEYKDEKGHSLMLSPFAGWGGDPLRAILEPTFLPKRIKHVYAGEESEILKIVDDAFRPGDIFVDDYDNNYTRAENEAQHSKYRLDDKQNKALEDMFLPASMVGHLKHYLRYSDALSTTLESSRANALPLWTQDTMKMTKDGTLVHIADLLDQVYGDKKLDVKLNGSPIGKHVVGTMMARVIYAKTLAAVAESERPNFGENLKYIFAKEDRPFDMVAKFLFGPNFRMREGFLYSEQAERTQVVFGETNPFGAQMVLDKTLAALVTSDQNMKGWDKYYWLKGAKATIGAASTFSRGR